MIKKHFVFSYTNILAREIEKKNYFSFTRKIFNLFYKLLINILKKLLGFSINLDNNKASNKFFNLSINDLFEYFNCDKGSNFKISENKRIKAHNYSVFYEKYLNKIKNENFNFLELGSHEGKGIAAFYHFFPNAKLIGANINPFQMRYYSNRIEEVYIDVSSKKILQNFINYFDNRFQIIIDDASHNLRDILITLPILFKKLNSGGFYVIEDINQFDVFKNLNPTREKLTPIKILKFMQENKSFDSDFISKEDVNYLKENIAEYHFEKGEMVMNGYNISDIVFLKKR
jgi:hypothetical protein